MLINRNNSVKEVGYGLGFSSLATFYRNFRKFNGLSPTEYRLKVL